MKQMIPQMGLRHSIKGFCYLRYLLHYQRSNLAHTLKPISLMATPQPSSSKRPMCSSCSKPTALCLCSRLKTPRLDNSVSVSILQHTLEQKHPLNSARIATIGLKNLNIVPVSDVNFEARFSVQLLRTCAKMDSFDTDGESKNSSLSLFNSDGIEDLAFQGFVDSGGGKMDYLGQSDVDLNDMSDFNSSVSRGHEFDEEMSLMNLRKADFGFVIGKYGVSRSFCCGSMMLKAHKKPSFDELLCNGLTISNGFVVKKFQRKSEEEEESEEFELTVPPGSVLLFPSDKASSFEAIDIEVRNLIVLDGTWAKAKRMYNENPWLKLLPHLKLDLDTVSLFSDVRHQPKAGYLSTIESIVYGLKAVGQDSLGLDDLLDVFDSMVGDQRRCKNERISRKSSVLCS